MRAVLSASVTDPKKPHYKAPNLINPATIKSMLSKYYLRNFVPEHHYHAYNRGSHKQNIFLDKEDHCTFIDILSYYLKFPTGSPRSTLARQNKPKSPNKVPNLVEATSTTSFHLACYCPMPNHFRFLFKQLKTTHSGKQHHQPSLRFPSYYLSYFT